MMKNEFLLLFISLVFSSCSSVPESPVKSTNNFLNLEKLEFFVEKNETIAIDFKENEMFFKIKQRKALSYIELNNLKIDLPFELNQFNFYNAYKADVDKLGKVLILEYGLYGASGLSANIVFTTVLGVSTEKLHEIFTYSSFLKGSELMSIDDKGNLTLYILKVNRNINTGKEEYCATYFKYDGGFKNDNNKTPECFKYTDEGELEKVNECSCAKLKLPSVYF